MSEAFERRSSPRTQRFDPEGSRRLFAVRALLPAVALVAAALEAGDGTAAPAGEARDAAGLLREIKPILEEFCYDCHGDGAKKGGVAFDGFDSAQSLLDDHGLWLKALRNLRASIMPPPGKARPSPEQRQRLERWIKAAVFREDPGNPDPGRVTVRRLNRVEYRNTIRDLLGVDFPSEKEFPLDDAGHGFDNIGDVLTLSPMLLEKYLGAARTIVTKAVPSVPAVPAEEIIPGRSFRRAEPDAGAKTDRGPAAASALTLSYYEPASARHVFKAEHAGRYQLILDFSANERYVDNQFDYNKCRLVFRADGKELYGREHAREGGKPFHHEFDQDWTAGDHEIVLESQPLTPDQKQVRSLTLRIDSVTVRGPMDEKYWVRPRGHERFFPGYPPRDDASARREYARGILGPFATKAYRRPVDGETVDRLAALAESAYTQKGKTFEQGIGQAMVAVLASPRFLFREEGIQEPGSGSARPLVDEYALASRLSYFLWSSMPDDELLELAAERRLRSNLASQTKRMLADKKSEGFVLNFVGQWLQTRDIETVQIDARQVLGREAAPDPEQDRRRQRFRDLREKPEADLTPEEKKEIEELRGTLFRRFGRAPRAELTGDLRRAMRQETEKAFDYIIHEDRSLLELLDSDYTFLNERLARHYGLTDLGVTGDEMRLVKLPPDSPRGGVITHGSVLAVTSNPTRTSPVKRGLFILDNLLGMPPAPPPPDIPPLEDAARAMKEKTLTLRETLALHREAPLCASCHNRMDPLGLALENFNAMGMWRDQERGQPIDATGQLLSGEGFANVKELKRILAGDHSVEFYRTVTEKMLTYALGRGLEYHDVATVDAIVERLERSNGSASMLLTGIIESAPFQRTRAFHPPEDRDAATPEKQRPNRKIRL
jgi:mono/diheme cytochrome c family protein